MKSKKEKLIETAKSDKVMDAQVDGEKSKKNKIGTIIISAILVILAIVGIVFAIDRINNNVESDGDKFKAEYEGLNGKYDNERSRDYLEIKLSNTDVIKYSSYDEVFDLLDNGTGVIYFGFKECPWCRNLIPNLLNAAKEAGIDRIYYLSNKEDRDIKSKDDDGNVVVEKEGTADYYKLVEKLGDNLSNYSGVDENSKRLYFPTVVFVKDGKIVNIHISTLDSQTDSKVPLTDEQKRELVDILVEKMNSIIVCDEAC